MGDVVQVIRGISFPKDAKRSEYQSGLVACLRTANVQKDVEWEDLWFVESHYVRRDNQYIRKDDILISTANSLELLGKVAIVKEIPHNATLGTFIANIRVPLSHNSIYFYYYLKSQEFKQNVRDRASTTTNISNISVGKLTQILLRVPPLPVQRQIVARIEELFSELDAGVAELKTALARLKTYRQAVLHHYLNNPDWERVSIREYIESITSGKSFRCVERPPLEDEFGVAKVSAVSWGEYDEQESKTCIEASRFNEAYLIRPGDFLFSRANTIELVGACVIVKQVTLPIMLSDKILRIRFYADLLDQRFILYFLKSRIGRNQIEKLSTGNQESMRNIGQERIRQIEFSIPPDLSTQAQVVSEIETRLSGADVMEATIRQELARAENLRQSILKQAFDGKLVTDVVTPTPGTELAEVSEPVSPFYGSPSGDQLQLF